MKIDFSGISKKIKAFFTSKDVLIFSLFVLLSTAFWFMNTLNINREMRLSVPIHYIGLPENIMIEEPLPHNISLRIQDNGKNLFTYYKKENITPVIIDLSNTQFEPEGEISISKTQMQQKITSSLRSTTHLLGFSPDTLGIQYTKLTSKRIPVRLNGEVSPAPQHVFRQRATIQPDSITIFCAEQLAAQVTEARTQYVDKENITDTLSETIPLQAIENVRFSKNAVKLTAISEMFTEKSFTLPIKPANMPFHLNVRTFPADATVTFNVGISNFNDIEAKDITVLFDYRDLRPGSNRHELEIAYDSLKTPIFNIRIKPHEVEYILEEQ